MMDRALKERIIGAVVLVLFVVLVVPIFLDGPPGEGDIIRKSVPLPGQSEQEAQKTVVLKVDREDPMPPAARNVAPAVESDPKPSAVEQTTASAPPDPEPVVEQKKPVTTKKESPNGRKKPVAENKKATTTTTVAATTASATGMWAVQLGSFGEQKNAERLAADLRKKGFAAFLSQLGTDSGPLHRVRIGPQKDRESAEAMAARLAKVGLKGQVVPHP